MTFQKAISRQPVTFSEDRCWLTMTQAFANGQIANIYGGAGLLRFVKGGWDLGFIATGVRAGNPLVPLIKLD